MEMPEHIRALLDEMDVLLEQHKAALLAKDTDAAHEYGEKLYAFVERHGKTMLISDEQMEAMRRSRAKADASWQQSKISRAEAEKSRLEYEESVEKYHEALLELPPQGKNRTSH